MITAEEKSSLVVGYKQVCKAVKNGVCKKIFLSGDCSLKMSDELHSLAGSIEIVSVPTMTELGNMCEIDVPASCAAVISL